MGLFSGLMGGIRRDADPRRQAWLLEQLGMLPEPAADGQENGSGVSRPPPAGLPPRPGADSAGEWAAGPGRPVYPSRSNLPDAQSNRPAGAPGFGLDDIARAADAFPGAA